MKRGWWKDLAKEVGTKRGFINPAEANHVIDAFELLERIPRCCGQDMMDCQRDASNLLNRGEKPEPEWGKLGKSPDSAGHWQRCRPGSEKTPQESWKVWMHGQLWMALDMNTDCRAPVDYFDHRGWRYRKVSE